MILSLPEIPIPVGNLDAVRVPVMVSENKKVSHYTNKIGEHSPRQLGERSWRGIAAFQTNGATRRKMGMMATCLDAKKTAKISQQRAQNKQQRRKINEKQLPMEDRQLFYLVKVKELRSCFERGVWEFSTAADADPNSTLTPGILLKWSKNPDGHSPAKARLVVRGYLLSVSTTKRWRGWSAGVSTAFLQELLQERDLWIRLPQEALLGCGPETRMHVHKPVYGQLGVPRRMVA